jgi:signal transduction histidine kinase
MLLIEALLVTGQAHVQDRARETAEHANRMKSDFLATISHELRTPMNGVLGMLALLEGDDITPAQRQQAATARRSAEGLLDLLDDILDFSKLEAGKSVIDAGNCDPVQIANVVVELLRPKAEAKGLALSLHIGPSVPDAVVTESTRLRQILFNLVGNAIKFTASGEVSVRAQRGTELPGNRFLLEFEVEDTGIGIAPEVIPKLFRHFTQADSSITRTYGGSGLGLAICKRLCELLGGSISISGTPGKGSLVRQQF